MIYRSFIFVILIALLPFLHSCKSASKPDPNEALKKEIVAGYARMVSATYRNALEEAKKLNDTITVFLAKPDEANLAAAKRQWLIARKAYSETEAYRFYAGPIDNGEQNLEAQLNSWPLDEVYVDYVESDAGAGIINNNTTYPNITADLLTSMNQSAGENNISTGYHAIEFLLWGQDLSATGPGNRPVSDYQPEKNNSAQRRADYLRIVSELLVQQLTILTEAWKEDQKNYRYDFVHLPPDEALEKMMTGIAVLSKMEMAGERMFTAYNNASQEDEQSCFSDNTLNDLKYNFAGIERVYTNNLKIGPATVHSPSISDLVEKENPELGAKINTALADAKARLDAIPEPFDQAIVNEATRPLVLDAVKQMQHIGDLFSEAATSLGLSVNTNAVAE